MIKGGTSNKLTEVNSLKEKVIFILMRKEIFKFILNHII